MPVKEQVRIDDKRMQLVRLIADLGFTENRDVPYKGLGSSYYLRALPERLARGEIEGYVVLPFMNASDKIGVMVCVKPAQR